MGSNPSYLLKYFLLYLKSSLPFSNWGLTFPFDPIQLIFLGAFIPPTIEYLAENWDTPQKPGVSIDRILCYEFSLNPLRFSLVRETNSKMTNAKSWAICKTSIHNSLFPSVSVMLCSHFFHFSKQKVFNLYFLQFLKERKTFSFETKTEGFLKIWK